ncbi:Outer membrane protein assembly factor BamB, contains PQQ-like beta-propeller repeat [Flavobacterium gillisiae]|uniref:Outer membrane protein assembly factor BamB, contains PQQ-like beta-propeller repeat n=2 Tax=Flavobacterium gillisiae TaxID=150146 RepID=A0A1H4C7Y2_9FLAO|nr:Outer membrane protein assembly factor BamB, contains PQQ-like beta-propeller repeat [Flavobacterium gillisiae]
MQRGNNSNSGYTENNSPKTKPSEKWVFKPGLGPGFGVHRLAAANGIVVSGSLDGNVIALDMSSGKQRWFYKIEEDTNQNYSTFSYPTFLGSTVFIGTFDHGNDSFDKYLYAIDIVSGQKKWKSQIIGGVEGSPKVHDGNIYFGSTKGYLYSINAANGQENWKVTVGDKFFSSVAINLDNIIIRSKNYVYSFNISTGVKNWSKYIGYSPFSCPVINNNTVLVVGFKSLYAFDINSGAEKWSFQTDNNNSFSYINSPAVAYGTVYFVDLSNTLYAVDINTGVRKWKFAVQNNNVSGSEPVVANGLVYFGVDYEGVFAIDAYTGTEKWKFEANNCLIDDEFVISNGILYFNDGENIKALK